ncbi:hypothetical protein [Bartonella tribocorum]|uniref:hypothetical protein n=1 Tax=Bartonella tribocorum TaxID=85701 RepID=UPI00030E48DE|nr:hypothetical protein [Bartonella tribocorum]
MLSFIGEKCWGESLFVGNFLADRGALVRKKEEGMSAPREGEKLVGGWLIFGDRK